MSVIFLEILKMSFNATWVIVIVMAIRLSLKKAPKIYSYTLWAVVFVRLICPFTIPLPTSNIPLEPPNISQYIWDVTSLMAIDSDLDVDASIRIPLEEETRRMDNIDNSNTMLMTNPWELILKISTYMWGIGLIILLFYGILTYMRLKKRVITGIRIQHNIYETDQVKTPFILGFIRPKIYIPTGLLDMELEYVIAHERAHIKRYDHLIRPITYLIMIIHWFNPLVWLAFGLMGKDMELSIDEQVMKQYDSDIRRHYSNTLLGLSINNKGFLSPLAFGERNVKVRIKNILNYKKPSFWVTTITTLVVISVSVLLMVTKKAEAPPNELPQSNIDKELKDEIVDDTTKKLKDEIVDDTTTVKSVFIEYLSEQMGYRYASQYESTNNKVVGYIDSVLSESNLASQAYNLDNNYTNQYRIQLAYEVGSYSCMLYYDTLYNKAYIVKDGGQYEVGTDFARYIDSFLENRDIVLMLEDREVVELFHSYGWTLDYLLNTQKIQLNKIDYLDTFNPSTYYFAYNNVLSMDIGMDMRKYANNTEVEVDIYRLHEAMPEDFYPIQNARGIVVKKDGNIIGAFISSGRHSTFNACSLKGNSFETITGNTINQWLTDVVKADGVEKNLANMLPEQIIETYFDALKNQDVNIANASLSKVWLLSNLSSNITNQELCNLDIILPLTGAQERLESSFNNLKSVEFLSSKLIHELSGSMERVYDITVNLNYYIDVDLNGEQQWKCYMVYESEATGWKIKEFGH